MKGSIYVRANREGAGEGWETPSEEERQRSLGGASWTAVQSMEVSAKPSRGL